MRGKQTLFLADCNRDNRRIQLGRRRADGRRRLRTDNIVQLLAHPDFGIIPERTLGNLPRLARPILGRSDKGSLEHVEFDLPNSIRFVDDPSE